MSSPEPGGPSSTSRLISRKVAGAAAGAVGGLAVFVLASISLTMSLSALGLSQQNAIVGGMSQPELERLSRIGHLLLGALCVAAGAILGILPARRLLGNHWRWMAYGALAGVAVVVLASFIVDSRFPNAELFDSSENAAFEFKFRAAQSLAILGAALGISLYQIRRNIRRRCERRTTR